VLLQSEHTHVLSNDTIGDVVIGDLILTTPKFFVELARIHGCSSAPVTRAERRIA
jgi:hypothetical protein